jgi:DNA processing protein
MTIQLSLDSLADPKNNRPLNLLDWLSLSLMKGAGPTRLDRLWQYLTLLEMEGDHEATFCSELDTHLFIKLKWPKDAAHQAGLYCQQRVLSAETESKLQHTLEWLKDESHHLIIKGDMDYPIKLSEIPVPPILLYVKGNLECLSRVCLGMVGARRCSHYGRQLGFQFSKQISEEGITVVSGGATGIDSAAHEGANAVNRPNIAVMGTGFEKLYPKANVRLFENILKAGGAWVSEYPLMTSARPNLFPPRNRIISGLSEGVLVVEATEKSGSLISASYALQHNREVFAIPGRIDQNNAQGCHRLIQQGATLVMDVDDVLNELVPVMVSSQSPITQSKGSHEGQARSILMQPVEVPISSLSSVARSVLVCFDKVDKESILEFSDFMDVIGCSISDLMQALVELEMLACIEPYTTGYRRCYCYP